MSNRTLAAAIFALSLGLVLYELVLTRVFAIVLFAQFAHLAISLALLGVSVGALALHLFPRLLPEDRLASRLGWLSLAMGIAMVAAVWATVRLPLTRVTDDLSDQHVVHFLARQKVMSDLVQTRLLGVLIPLLALPFAGAGAAFAAAFRRAREALGLVYAADLCGGAMGCLLFVPALSWLRGPDVVAVCALAAGLAAWLCFREAGRRGSAVGAALLVGAALAAVAVGRDRTLLPIRYAAGFDERGVVEDVWTPLTRLAVFENADRAFVMLDNASRSEVLLTVQRHWQYAREPYSIVFRLVSPPSRIAVLAAGAGPDIVTALNEGHRDITAIELAPEFFEIVRRRYPHIPVNPYRTPGVRTVGSDARSAMMREPGRFDIIEMSQANLYSSGGLLAQAWQAGLLVTEEAFATYLDHLTDRGIISIYGSMGVSLWARNAAAALRARGVRAPWAQMAFIGTADGARSVLLLKAKPFTAAEVQRIDRMVAVQGCKLLLDPLRPTHRWLAQHPRRARYETDDRPYFDAWSGLVVAARSLLRSGGSREVSPVQLLQRVLLVQLAFLIAAGAVLLGLPLAWRGRREIGGQGGAAVALGYFAAIGYGYLAVEIVLLHELVLFLGDPTYAITLVLFTLLVSSGLGSLWAGRIRVQHVRVALPAALGCVVVLSALHAFVVAPQMTRHLLGLPLIARDVLVVVALLPLGVVMGMSFPLAMRRLPPSGAALLPWCWAINGWMSVVAAVVTVLVARIEGYQAAFVVALAAYACALVLSRRLAPRSAPG